MTASLATLAGKKVLVMGLGRFGGGVGVARWLVEQGAKVTVNDAEGAEKLGESIKQLDGLPIAFKLGGHRVEDFLAADLLVINPAVDKRKSAVVREALAKGIAYTTEMNLFLERCPATTIGVTGSVGKSTTTALIYEALKEGIGDRGKGIATPVSSTPCPLAPSPSIFLGGNIGKSLLLDLPRIRGNDVVVLELSSFMLEDTAAMEWSPNIAVVTNLFPNHLDRHDTLAAYAAAKQNILRYQKAGDAAVLNNDQELVFNWGRMARGKVFKFTTRGPSNSLPLSIPGEHNQSNAQAALAVLAALEGHGIRLDKEAAIRAMTGFAGLAHRLQLVHTREAAGGRKVRFYNDSKATTPEASMTALNAFPPHSAVFLVGGYDKHLEMSRFEKVLAERAGGVIGIGQTGRGIIENVHRAGGSGDLPSDRIVYAGTLEAALPLAYGLAAGNPALSAIVLSPASASWDQFPNYEKRGEIFTALARKI